MSPIEMKFKKKYLTAASVRRHHYVGNTGLAGEGKKSRARTRNVLLRAIHGWKRGARKPRGCGGRRLKRT